MKKSLAALFIIFTLTAQVHAAIPEIRDMTLREKVGQLFVIRPEQIDPALTPEQVHNESKYGSKTFTKSMLETLNKYPAGGFIIFRKNLDKPAQLKALTKALHEASEIYPIMAIDEEGGAISRIANHKNFKVKKFKSAEAIAKNNQTYEAAS